MHPIEMFTLAALLLGKQRAMRRKAPFCRMTGRELAPLLAGFLAVSLLVTALEFSAGENQDRLAAHPTASGHLPQSHEGKLK